MRKIFTNACPLVLASASPRRQLFLDELGLTYSIVRPTGVEPRPLEEEVPASYACRAAAAKAKAVAKGPVPADAVIIAADTVVALDDEVLGKPEDAEDALRMLRQLAGKGHSVISAVSVIFPGGDAPDAADAADVVDFYDTTEVHFHDWPEEALRAYAYSGEPLDKAGAYAIQGQGAFLVEAIRGSWSTVVGLPVTQLVALLLERGVIVAVGNEGS